MGRYTINTPDTAWNLYYKNIIADFHTMKKHYPFSYLTIPPTSYPEPATIRVVAVNRKLIEMTAAVESDFTEEYSRELHLIVPLQYKQNGCDVCGADLVDIKRLENKDIHFFHENGHLIKSRFGYKICVGTPESFSLMKNVILENIKTAENMLIAYERLMREGLDHLELIAYAHGDIGREQFKHNKARYIPKG